MKKIGRFLKDVFKEWLDDNVSRRAAGLSFYTLLSLAPLLLMLMSALGLFVGAGAAKSAIVEQTQGLIGATGAQAVQSILEHASRPGTGGVGLVLGVIVLLFGATGVFGEMQSSLNWMWDLRTKPGEGMWWGLLRSRLISLGAIAGLGFILIVSLVISEGVSAFARAIGGSPGSGIGLVVVTQLASLVVFTLLTAFAFKVLPDARIAWRDLWVGALVTAVLFLIGKAVLGLYLSHSSATTSYGAAGSLVVLLLWVYYSAQIFFTGAEITQVYSRQYGHGIEPDERSELIPETSDKPKPPERKRSQPEPRLKPDSRPQPEPRLKLQSGAKTGGSHRSARRRSTNR